MLISARAQKVLKVIHLLTVSYWIGGCLAVFTLYYASFGAQNDDELFGILLSSRFVGIVVVVYMGAFASFFTGLAYSICTNRGFVRHKWIILKWGITVFLIFFGAGFIGNWSTRLFELADKFGVAAMDYAEFQTLRNKLLTAMCAQMALLIVATVISVYRPWEESENAALYRKKGLKDKRGMGIASQPDTFGSSASGDARSGVTRVVAQSCQKEHEGALSESAAGKAMTAQSDRATRKTTRIRLVRTKPANSGEVTK